MELIIHGHMVLTCRCVIHYRCAAPWSYIGLFHKRKLAESFCGTCHQYTDNVRGYFTIFVGFLLNIKNLFHCVCHLCHLIVIKGKFLQKLTVAYHAIRESFKFLCYFDLLIQVTLKNRSNAIAWNPMEAYMFTVANEDYK